MKRGFLILLSALVCLTAALVIGCNNEASSSGGSESAMALKPGEKPTAEQIEQIRKERMPQGGGRPGAGPAGGPPPPGPPAAR